MYGLRVWDLNGNITLDVSDSLSKVLGTLTLTFTVPSGQFSGPPAIATVEIPGAFSDRFWWGSIAVEKINNQYPMSDGYLKCNVYPGQAVFTLSDSAYITIEPGSTVRHTIVYGVF